MAVHFSPRLLNIGRWLWLPALLLVLFSATWFFSRSAVTPTQRLALDAQCDLSSTACELAVTPNWAVTAMLTPQPPSVMTPLTLAVTSEAPVAAVWVELVGLNMEMGFTRSELLPQADGLWKGQVMLPICSSRRMLWEARVFLQHNHGLVEAPFRFSTQQ